MLNTLLGADALLPARNQMAFSLAWHIVLSCFGMVFPVVIFFMHRKGINGNDDAIELAKRWSKVAAVLFSIGAVSGTVLSFEMGLLWPNFMGVFGDVFGTAFGLEGVAFFCEAIFLAIYVYGWDKLPPKAHMYTLVPMMIAGVAGGYMIISVNAWMNQPRGFDVVVNGTTYNPAKVEFDQVASLQPDQITNIRPFEAIFNWSAVLQFVHMYIGAIMVVGFSIAGIYAFGWLKGRRGSLHHLGLMFPLAIASFATPVQLLAGHLSGQWVADKQPIKLAAMEGVVNTERHAPMQIGGYWNGDKVVGAIEIPDLLSLIAKNSPDAEIVGLDTVQPDDRPPVEIVHFSFDMMVMCGSALILVALWVLWRWWKHRAKIFDSKWFLYTIFASGFLAILALEFGWITTEVGRQPYIAYKIMRTEDAVTHAGYIWWTFAGVVIIYTALTVGAYQVIKAMQRRWNTGIPSVPSPYGPAEISKARLAEAKGTNGRVSTNGTSSQDTGSSDTGRSDTGNSDTGTADDKTASDTPPDATASSDKETTS